MAALLLAGLSWLKSHCTILEYCPQLAVSCQHSGSEVCYLLSISTGEKQEKLSFFLAFRREGPERCWRICRRGPDLAGERFWAELIGGSRLILDPRKVHQLGVDGRWHVQISSTWGGVVGFISSPMMINLLG